MTCSDTRPDAVEGWTPVQGASAPQTGPSQVEPVPVSPLRASVPSAEITAILAEYDEYISPCPINNPTSAYAPDNKCERCGARADQNCGLEVTASWHLIKALRRVAGGAE